MVQYAVSTVCRMTGQTKENNKKQPKDLSKLKFDRHCNGSILLSGGGTSGSTFGYLVSHVCRTRPALVIMENVEALADDKKPNLQHLKTSFHDLNYAIAYCVLQTHEFGIPQDRKRAITHTHTHTHKTTQPLQT